MTTTSAASSRNAPRLVTLAFALFSSPLLGAAATAAEPRAPELVTDDQKILYVLGLEVARNLAQFQLSPADLASVQAGLADGVLGKSPRVPPSEWGPKLEDFAKARSRTFYDRELAAGTTFLATEAAKPGVRATASGLLYSEITPGTGASPNPADTVTVHYRGTLRDGTVFDSSIERGQPATFALDRVIPCWTEGVGMMKVGGKSRLVCPASIAYGERGTGPIPPGSTLVFEVELLSIAPPKAPAGG